MRRLWNSQRLRLEGGREGEGIGIIEGTSIQSVVNEDGEGHILREGVKPASAGHLEKRDGKERGFFLNFCCAQIMRK